MKKLFLLLIALLVSFSLFAAESEEATGDVSGNDLNPILRGLHLQFSGGVVGLSARLAEKMPEVLSVRL